MSINPASIKVIINGYGNLGRAVELAVQASPDMQAVAVFTRRDPASVLSGGTPVVSAADLPAWAGRADVCINCGGSATDLPKQGPETTQWFNTVDSFDTHAHIPDYFAQMDRVAREYDHATLLSTGWDPGLFSVARILGESVLPAGQTYTFWGRGVSQGHSDAIRRISGVANAVQYTVPVQAVKDRIKAGEQPELSTRDKHIRHCFVVLEAGADQDAVRQEIITMPNYFADYDTVVEFVSAQELARDHAGMPHGGEVIRSGSPRPGINQVMSFQLNLDSNPDFTAAMVTASARALVKLYRAGARGAYTVFDVPPAYYSPRDPADLRRDLL